MNPSITPPEPKDGNRGKRKPTLPLTYIKTDVTYEETFVTYTVVWEDALGERYIVHQTKFYYELDLV